VRIEIVYADGVVVGEERVAVARGDEVEIIVVADVADEVHLHGYDYTADVDAGRQAILRFVADLPGIFELELERTRVVLVELEVR
jgi:hypothetical protein